MQRHDYFGTIFHRLCSPAVQRSITAGYAACFVFLLAIEGAMTLRFAALLGHFPDVSDYASSVLFEQVAFCEKDDLFRFCAFFFRSETAFFDTIAFLVLPLLALLGTAAILKQKLFVFYLLILISAYLLYGIAPCLLPLTRYYLIGYG